MFSVCLSYIRAALLFSIFLFIEVERERSNFKVDSSCFPFPLKIIPDSIGQQYPKPQLQNSRQQKGEAPTLNFKANKEYFGLSIVGIPGNKGWLKITAPSAKARHPDQILYIAFMLAPCLWGFDSKNISKDGLLQRVRDCDLEWSKILLIHPPHFHCTSRSIQNLSKPRLPSQIFMQNGVRRDLTKGSWKENMQKKITRWGLWMICVALPRGSVKNNMTHVALQGRGTTSAYNCFPASGMFSSNLKFFASVKEARPRQHVRSPGALCLATLAPTRFLTTPLYRACIDVAHGEINEAILIPLRLQPIWESICTNVQMRRPSNWREMTATNFKG